MPGGLDRDRFWQIRRGAVGNGKAVCAVERADAERMEELVRGSDERLPASRSFTYLFGG